MSKYNYNKNFFEKIDDERKAYWLGFLYADGCICERFKNGNLKSMSLELGLASKDEEHLNKFIFDLESDVPIHKKTVKLNGNTYLASRVIIHNTKLCKDLIKCGCVPRKSLILTFPNEDILPKKLIKHFIRGYIDGDGCVFFSKKDGKLNCCKVSIVGTKDMLKQITEYFLENNIAVNGTFTEKGNAFQLFIHGEDTLIDIYNHVYKDSKVFLSRKKEKYEEMIKEIWLKNPKWSGKHGVSYCRTKDRWRVSYCPNYEEKHQPNNKWFKNFEEAKDFRIKFEINKIRKNNKINCPNK